MQERNFRKLGLRERVVLGGASVVAAASAILYGGGPRVSEARDSKANIEQPRIAEQIKVYDIEDGTGGYFDVASWVDPNKASTPQELIDAYHKEKPAKMGQSMWLISAAGGGEGLEEGFIPGAPPFASKLKMIPAGRRVVVVANRRAVETPPATALPPSGQAAPTPAPTSEKLPPAEPTPKPKVTERITEAQVDALAREVDRLVLTGGFPLTSHYQIIDGRVVPLDQAPIWPGLPNKRVDGRLGAAMKVYLRWLHANRKWGHGLDGRSSSERVRDYGYIGNTREILGTDELNYDELPPAMSILLGWLNSPEHRGIIEDPSRPDFKFACNLVEVVGVDDKGRPTPPRPSLDCGGLFGRETGK